MNNTALFWHRRDLRTEDNRGLHAALASGLPVQPIFIFDSNILNELEDQADRRVLFIHQQILRLDQTYTRAGGGLRTYYGDPIELWPDIVREHGAVAVYTCADYEPYGTHRDQQVACILSRLDVAFNPIQDHIVLPIDLVTKSDGSPYAVFTPYSRKYKELITDAHLRHYPSEDLLDNIAPLSDNTLITHEEMGFIAGPIEISAPDFSDRAMKNYEHTRDIPSIQGTSRLSVHLRFGTLSIRSVMKSARRVSEKFWNELLWREFYMMILYHDPEIVQYSLKRKYDRIPWRNNKLEFNAWCEGKTGYPIVDAGMRQLNSTGWMHNRVRMIVASFLTKHLLIDWRWGEAYFAQKLIDYELASNNGGWQWAAGSGADAAPYFRIFNPSLQQKKFDPDGIYIRQWVQDIDTLSYPDPIVDHKAARERALAVYRSALK